MATGWRTKFVFVLMVYFAGFATAIYCLAPPPEKGADQARQTAGARPVIKSDEFARSVNSGMHKCIDFGKEAAIEAARLIRERMEEVQLKSDG